MRSRGPAELYPTEMIGKKRFHQMFGPELEIYMKTSVLVYIFDLCARDRETGACLLAMPSKKPYIPILHPN